MPAVKMHLESTTLDRDSVDIGKCAEPRLSDSRWVTTCKVRGKNGLDV